MEEFSLGQNGKSGSAGGFQGLREGNGIEGLTENASRGGSVLEFRENIEAIASERRGKIAKWSSRSHAILQRGLGEDAVGVVGLGAGGRGNAGKGSSGFGVGNPKGKFVC